MKFLALAAAALLLASISAVSAAECQFPFDATVKEFTDAGAPVALIDPADMAEVVTKTEAATGQDYGTPTRGFFVIAGGKVLLGLEVDGCLLPPIVVGVTQPHQLSGQDKNGRIGA